MPIVALDANLLLLLIVGHVAPRAVAQHKKLGQYDEQSFALLLEVISTASEIVATPNVMTEVANQAPMGLSEPYRTAVMRALRTFAENAHEVYVPSRVAVVDENYIRLGLTDAAWIVTIADRAAELWTDDHELYLTALNVGLTANMFTHLRKSRGHL